MTAGIDGSDGQIYGRVALFSVLTFSMHLGTAPHGSATREVTVDIDQLAKHQPNDINKHEVFSAPGRIQAPEHATEGFANAIANGTQQRAFAHLMGRMEEHQLSMLARDMSKALAPCSNLSPLDARTLIEKVLNEQLQQIWRLVRAVLEGLKEKVVEGNMAVINPMLDSLIAYDVHSTSGLSQQAEAMLNLGRAALAVQMEEDCSMRSALRSSWAEAQAFMPWARWCWRLSCRCLVNLLNEPPKTLRAVKPISCCT